MNWRRSGETPHPRLARDRDDYAFFDRFPDRRVNEADIIARTPILVEFNWPSSSRYNLAGRPVLSAFSHDGAIMAAALLLIRLSLLAGAILFRPLSSLASDPPTRLDGSPVLIFDGEKDSRRIVRVMAYDWSNG